MRYFEIQGGFNVPVSSEEMALLCLAEDAPVPPDELDERQQEVVRKMVSRGVMRRLSISNREHVSPNVDNNLRRF